ncbi:hypothetical protein PRIEUP_LOCUS12110 [Pristimantis euphronides]
MWSLCVLYVLLSPVSGQVSGSSGQIYTLLGYNVSLPLRYNLNKENKTCYETFEWKFGESRISRSRDCNITENISKSFSHKTSQDGQLTLINVTFANSGNYTITVHRKTGGAQLFMYNYSLHVLAPVSETFVNASCLSDGGASIICRTNTVEDLRFSITANGYSLLNNSVSSRTVETVSEVNTTVALPGPWKIVCSASNRLSDVKHKEMKVTCPAPLSKPVLVDSCLHNGNLEISCSVENGTDPIFYLSVNGTSCSTNVEKEMKSINAILSSPGPWDVHCYVNNSLGGTKNNNIYKTCPVPLSAPIINASCQNDGTAKVVCEVAEGSNATYNWIVNGKLIEGNTVANLTLNASEFESGTVNISCSAENSVSKTQSNDITVFCEAPVSEPLLNASCLSNGSAVITCLVLSGTNPIFHLTVNGSVITPLNTSSSCCGFNYIMSQRGTLNISCSVGNKAGKSRTNIPSHSCSERDSNCSTCLTNSAIGGVVALIGTISPLLIASFYIGRNTRKQQR